jgi:hypothetical protein
VLGTIVLQNRNGRIEQKNLLYFEHIVESSLMTCTVLDDLRSRFPGFDNAQLVTIWMDVGPHFRSYQFLAHMAGSWFPALKGKLRICWFPERRGKGEGRSIQSLLI